MKGHCNGTNVLALLNIAALVDCSLNGRILGITSIIMTCHPEPARRKRAGEGPYDVCEVPRKRSGWPPLLAQCKSLNPP